MKQKGNRWKSRMQVQIDRSRIISRAFDQLLIALWPLSPTAISAYCGWGLHVQHRHLDAKGSGGAADRRDDGIQIGLLSGVRQLPRVALLLFTMIGGVMADRLDRL
jgi:hypothetical protein